MDKDDGFKRPSGQHDGQDDFNDDARYDDAVSPAVREEEYAAGQEEWDQPVDEFAEDEQQLEGTHAQPQKDPFAEEGPLEDEYTEHAEHDPEMDDGQQAKPSGKPTPMAGAKTPSPLMKNLPFIGGGIVALVLAFFGYQQFMGGSTAAPSAPSIENQNTWDNQAANPAPKNTQMANTQAANPQAANPQEFQQPATPPAQPETASNTSVQPAMDNSPANTHTNAPAEQPAQQTMTAPLPTAQATAQATPAAPNPLEARITELTQQLEQMKQTQDQLNQKLQAAASAPPSMDEGSKAASKALEDRIAQLEQKLTNAPATSNMSGASPVSTSSVDMPEPKAARKSARAKKEPRMVDQDQPDKPATKHSKHASTDFMAVKKTRSKKRRNRDTDSTAGGQGMIPAGSSSFQGWILRSAQPGSAWLSQGPYSSDLRRVVPGDKVQGLGTILSVHQIAGRWVVEGTQGAVR